MRSPEELRALAEAYVAELALTPELGELQQAIRYAAEGGKRVRATICLATTEAAGVEPEAALPAAAALEQMCGVDVGTVDVAIEELV